ncbi:MAG TPA: hypothetical protein VNT26_05685, partial [Candidatus Sulfotelmatobacter sp.]|nr:hypothetical protein [Candidatus Sulfotelmatobacter sp.]
LHNFFFLTRENQRWIGTGYLLANTDSGAGTLYHFQVETNVVYYSGAINRLQAQFDYTAYLLYKFGIATNVNLKRVADGVVHLRVTAFDPNGALILPYDPGFDHTNIVRNSLIRTNLSFSQEIEYTFSSNAVPATLELEIGFLENKTLGRLRSIPDLNAQREYLRSHAAQVHLFRQRIPVRNVDFSAYQ